MEFIRLCRPQMDTTDNALYDRVRVLEAEVESLRKNGVALPKAEQSEELVSEEPEEEIPKALPEDIRKIAEDWKGIVRQYPQPGRLSLLSCTPSMTEGGNKLLLLFDNKTDYGLMNTDEKKAKLVSLIASLVKVNIEVELKMLEEGESKSKHTDITVLNERIKNMKIQVTEE
jgi:DNA polymerase-3 subunit gamma/tau